MPVKGDILKVSAITNQHSHPVRYSEDRIIIPLLPDSCCCENPIVFKEKEFLAPLQLRQKGVDTEVWKCWLERLRDAVKAGNPSLFEHVITCIIPNLIVPVLGSIGCCYIAGRKYAVARKVQQCVDAFNQEVLMQHGMFCKLQSVIVVKNTSEGPQNVQASWLAIALSDVEIRALQSEPNIFVRGGFPADCCYCCACCFVCNSLTTVGGVSPGFYDPGERGGLDSGTISKPPVITRNMQSP
jgi:hypothetical protein